MALVEIAVRSAVILFVALLVTCTMRRAAPATRHLVWTLAVIGGLIVPVASALVPAWEVVPTSVELRFAARPAEAGSDELPPTRAGNHERGSHEPRRSPTHFVASGFSRKIPWLLATWALVAMVLLARIVAGIVAVRRIIRHARPAGPRWRALLEDASDIADVTRRARLLASDDIAVPMTWGGRRPALLLPREALDWPDDRALLVLLHELAHVRRADWMTHALARVLAALHWFNPLAWLALHAMTRERERACDDFVLARGAHPSDYAQHLLDIAREGIGGPAHTMAPAMARASELEGRLLSILTPRHREPRQSVTHGLIAAAVCLTAGIAGATAGVQRSAQPTVSSSPRPLNNWLLSNDDGLEEKQQARRERRSLDRLAQAAIADDNEDTRENATMALAVRTEPEVVDPLLRALKDPSSQVREKAALGLALRRDPRVVDSLLEAASDPDAQVREKVAIALGLSGDPRATDVLNSHLADPDPQVREKAASGLTLLSISSLVRSVQ